MECVRPLRKLLEFPPEILTFSLVLRVFFMSAVDERRSEGRRFHEKSARNFLPGSIEPMPSIKFALVLLGFVLLAACSNGPSPPPPENPAQTKADVQKREAFARDLPKPQER
jgi:hypothetical protein